MKDQTRCPKCLDLITRPATDGGTLVRGRFLRVTAKGEIFAGCPKCGSKVAVPTLRPVLILGRDAA